MLLTTVLVRTGRFSQRVLNLRKKYRNSRTVCLLKIFDSEYFLQTCTIFRYKTTVDYCLQRKS